MNLPTALTLVRILLVPVFMGLVLYDVPGDMHVAALVFVAAGLTDLLDGHIARHWQQVTKFGKLADPIADKLLVSGALISLVQRGDVSAWAATIIVGREFAVSGLRMLAASEGVVIAASLWGKVKTVAQMVAVVSILLKLPFAAHLMWVAVVLTVISGIDYFRQGQRFLAI